MNNEHVERERLPDLAAGLLDPVEARRVEAHVADCTACAEELALLRRLADARTPAPEGLEARIRQAMHRELDARQAPRPVPEIRLKRARRPWTWVLSPWTGAVAATLIAVVAGTLVLYDGDATGDTDTSALIAMETAAPYGTMPGADGELAGMATLDDLSEAQLEELLGTMQR
jgi:anti-sigma factor RsiW